MSHWGLCYTVRNRKVFSKEFSGFRASDYSKPWFLLDICRRKALSLPEDDSLNHTASCRSLRPQGASRASPDLPCAFVTTSPLCFSLAQPSCHLHRSGSGAVGAQGAAPKELGCAGGWPLLLCSRHGCLRDENTRPRCESASSIKETTYLKPRTK